MQIYKRDNNIFFKNNLLKIKKKEIQENLGFHSQQFNIKYQCGIGRNNTRMSTGAIGKVRGTGEFGSLTNTQLSNAMIPALDDISFA